MEAHIAIRNNLFVDEGVVPLASHPPRIDSVLQQPVLSINRHIYTLLRFACYTPGSVAPPKIVSADQVCYWSELATDATLSLYVTWQNRRCALLSEVVERRWLVQCVAVGTATLADTPGR